MDVQSQNHPYTLLRIKRKRTEEPLDGLVVEPRFRKKKARGDVDVFQFAQTVEHDAWQDNQLQQHLQSQISRLAQDSNENAKVQLPLGRETRVPLAPPRADNGARRYAIKVTDSGEDARPKRRPTSPPKVLSSKDISKHDFKMYDAVLEDQEPSVPPMDLEMEKFLPMLQDFLTLQESKGTSTTNRTTDDYVWDVFYRRPYPLSKWNSIATNVATLTGLPPSAEDGELSSDSQSEEEDEADEDSNAEEYYKNDYPDEESSDDDFFQDSTDDDELDSDPADSDHDWR